MLVSIAQEKTEKSVQKAHEVAPALVYMVTRLKITLAKLSRDRFTKVVLSKVAILSILFSKSATAT